MDSYETLLYEFVAKTILNSSEIADFSTNTLGTDRKVYIGMDEQEPPSMNPDEGGAPSIIIHSASPEFPEHGSNQIKTVLTLTAGHRKEEKIELAATPPTNTATVLKGKRDNANFAELVGKTVAMAINKAHIGVPNLSIQEILAQLYPNFVHMITISIITRKQYRESVFLQQVIQQT